MLQLLLGEAPSTTIQRPKVMALATEAINQTIAFIN